MKRFQLWVLCAFCTLLITSSSLSAADMSSQQRTVSIDDLVLLVSSGISDETILAFLKDRELDFLLSREIRLTLAQAGITNTVMRYLREQETALNPPLPADTARTAYSLANYSSYYGSGRISGSLFPLDWYSHHYFGSSHQSTGHPYIPVYGGSPGIDHGAGISHSLSSSTIHLETLLEHQNSLAHYILHEGSGLSHSTQHSLGHTVGHSAGRSGGHASGRTHNIGHTIGHSGGHTSRHAVGHTGSRHSGGRHRGGHSRRH